MKYGPESWLAKRVEITHMKDGRFIAQLDLCERFFRKPFKPAEKRKSYRYSSLRTLLKDIEQFFLANEKNLVGSKEQLKDADISQRISRD